MPKRRKNKIKKTRSSGRVPGIWKKIAHEWCELSFSNKMILIVGGLLLLELLSSVFLVGLLHKDCVEVLPYNPAFRSALSAIVGFILGGGSTAPEPEPSPISSVNSLPPNHSLFEKDSLLPEDLDEECREETQDIYTVKYLRTFIAGGICILCILVLFIAQTTHNLEYVNGLIQIRDLMATMTGFMVTHTSRNNKQ